MFTPQKSLSKIVLPPMPDIDLYPGFLENETAQYYFDLLFKELSFHSQTYTFGGEEIQTKRKMSYHSQIAYTYGNKSFSGKPWIPTLLELKVLVEKKITFDFNAVLCNFYENGQAGMGWHADKEKELGKNPVIASLSLGQTRKFAFRHRADVNGHKNPPVLLEYSLNAGDLLIMKGHTQQYFEHTLVKNKSLDAPRINLTFRKIIGN